MADVESQAVASWIQAGGVVAFAAAVLWELRLMRPILTEVKTVLASLLERERMRGEQRAELIELRRRHEESAPSHRHEDFSDATDAVSLPPLPPQKPKAKHKIPSNPRGYPIPSGYRPPSKPPDDED